MSDTTIGALEELLDQVEAASRPAILEKIAKLKKEQKIPIPVGQEPSNGICRVPNCGNTVYMKNGLDLCNIHHQCIKCGVTVSSAEATFNWRNSLDMLHARCRLVAFPNEKFPILADEIEFLNTMRFSFLPMLNMDEMEQSRIGGTLFNKWFSDIPDHESKLRTLKMLELAYSRCYAAIKGSAESIPVPEKLSRERIKKEVSERPIPKSEQKPVGRAKIHPQVKFLKEYKKLGTPYEKCIAIWGLTHPNYKWELCEDDYKTIN